MPDLLSFHGPSMKGICHGEYDEGNEELILYGWWRCSNAIGRIPSESLRSSITLAAYRSTNSPLSPLLDRLLPSTVTNPVLFFRVEGPSHRRNYVDRTERQREIWAKRPHSA